MKTNARVLTNDLDVKLFCVDRQHAVATHPKASL